MIELLGNHVWQSTLFAAAAGLLSWLLRTRGAQVRYGLWLAASLKFLVPFAALVALGSQFDWQPARGVAPNAARVIDAVGRPFSPTLPAVTVRTTAPAAVPVAISGVPVVLMATAGVVLVWMTGCAALMLAWIVRWRRVAAIVRRGSAIHDGAEIQILRRVERRSGFIRPIALVASDAPLEPGVFGIVRPVLLWPRSLIERLGDEQVEAILAHELCHIRRRDNLAAAVHALVQALFWFHPLVWWVGARLVAERERACDEEVLRRGSNPRVYAESILRTCQHTVESQRACVAGVTGSDLKRRIEQILTNQAGAPLTAWHRLVLGTAGLVAIAGPVAIGMVTTPRLRAQAPHLGNPRGFGPPDLNRLVGFELLPGPPRHPGDDPAGAVAWRLTVGHPAGRTSFVGFTGRGLIKYAYALQVLPVVAGPDWIDTESLELAVTSAEATDDEVRSALRRLFEDRFKLTAHHETRAFPVYALVPARDDRTLGPNLRRSTSVCIESPALRAALVSRELRRTTPTRTCGVDNGLTGITFEKVTMSGLAEGLSRSGPLMDRTVVDRTGISGTFDGVLAYGLLPAAAIATRYPVAALLLEGFGVRTVFKALPEQFGLKLADATSAADVLVIDRAQRP